MPLEHVFDRRCVGPVEQGTAERLALKADLLEKSKLVDRGRGRPVGEIEQAVRRDEGDLVLITLRVMTSITRSVMSTIGPLSRRERVKVRANISPLPYSGEGQGVRAGREFPI
jgi:hypothetical protein